MRTPFVVDVSPTSTHQNLSNCLFSHKHLSLSNTSNGSRIATMRVHPSQIVAFYHGLNASTRLSASRPIQRSLHQTSVAFRPRSRYFFTSNPNLANKDASTTLNGNDAASSTTVLSEPNSSQTQTQNNGNGSSSNKKKLKAVGVKKKLRDPLRRVASIAQRANQKPPKATKDGEGDPDQDYTYTLCAICVAEAFDMKKVVKILREQWYMIDPDGLAFDEEEVIHVRVRGGDGDFFIFETGTVVTWSLPPEMGVNLATGALLRAAENPHVNLMDRDDMTERLEYVEDDATFTSTMRGDTIVLATQKVPDVDSEPTDVGRAKIAFSSGLARSTKVAVLETLLNSYLEKTEELPEQLRRGELQVNKKAILQRTGELLGLRSQLNFFSELTDSLPDKFWDQRAELKLDSIYDQVGKALDVPSRIRVLNQRMDYAQDMLTTVREMWDSEHSSKLEKIIIWLIVIEVVFGIYEIYEGWEAKKAIESSKEKNVSSPVGTIG